MKKIFSILLVMLMFNITVCPVFAESTKAKEINLEYQQVDKSNNANIKTLDNNDSTLIKYNKKFKKYLDNFHYKVFKSDLVICSEHQKTNCYPMVDNFDMNNSSIIKINLLNGDYAIINKDVKSGDKENKYAAEYNKNGELMGAVKIQTIKKSKKKVLLSFAEYRIQEDDYYSLKLKHTMFLDIKQKGKKVDYKQFIYKFKGEKDYDLICWQNNNEIYVDEENQNLIVELKNFQTLEEKVTVKEKMGKITGSALAIILEPIGYVITHAIIIPGIVIVFTLAGF